MPNCGQFELIRRSSRCMARRGRIHTRHGSVETPVFMPVGTQGTVKALTPANLEEIGAEIILANTYHLYLRPGHELIRELGGLHKFMGWRRPILTDSGGFQIFSLGTLASIKEEGATFRSHLDGSAHFLSPEDAINIQEALNTDIMMCLDTCIPYPATWEETRSATDLTGRWARRSVKVKKDNGQLFFGIVQGGMFPDLRRQATEELVDAGFDGYALGGLSVGEPKPVMQDIIAETVPLLPQNLPIYVMGVGTPEDLVEGVYRGVDMFDCVMPTRNARNGMLFTSFGRSVIKNVRFRNDPNPVDDQCTCYTCRNFSRAYLRHLYMSREILAYHLNTIHNVHYFVRLFREIQRAIDEDRFEDFRRQFYALRIERN